MAEKENKMNFKEFEKQVVNEILYYLPEEFSGAKVQTKVVKKNNDTTRTGLLIEKPGQKCTPTIYLEEFYRKMEDEGVSLADTMTAIAKIRVDNDREFSVEDIVNFDKAKDRIFCRLVNKELNDGYLADKPFTDFNDLAVMYAVDCTQVGEEGVSSAPITHSLLKEYGITVEELDKVARENTEKKGYMLQSMTDILIEMMGEEMARAMTPPPEECTEMYILTNPAKMNGAAALLNAEALEAVSKTCGGDFVILPSSIHEVICLPMMDKSEDTVSLEKMVQEVNTTSVASNEVLSSNVYRYIAAEKKVVIAA